MADIAVYIESHKYAKEEVRQMLASSKKIGEFGKIQEHKQGNARGLEPTIMVALVGATGTVLGAVVAGLFQLISGKKDEKIVLRAANGASIEFPAHLSRRELEEKMELLKELEGNKYQILLP